MGIDKKRGGRSAVQFFSPNNTADDARYVAQVLAREIPVLQKTVNLK
ncbi:MAG: hypothetical protein L6V93_18355 [Clostridiales bacterium]|nr:MAG: hypothetical protein L6V93_18355 [Clostridiales bacterium]